MSEAILSLASRDEPAGIRTLIEIIGRPDSGGNNSESIPVAR